MSEVGLGPPLPIVGFSHADEVVSTKKHRRFGGRLRAGAKHDRHLAADSPPLIRCQGGSVFNNRAALTQDGSSSGGRPMSHAIASLHASFLLILPRIRTHGQVYFRSLDREKREELICEMVALCWRWFVRLAENGKDASLFPSALATFAARAVRGGRRCAGHERARRALFVRPAAARLHGGYAARTRYAREQPAHRSAGRQHPHTTAGRCRLPLRFPCLASDKIRA